MNRLNKIAQNIEKHQYYTSVQINQLIISSQTISMQNSEQVDVVAVIKFKPESVQAARPALQKLIEGTRNQPGNVRYNWYQDVKEAGTFVALESFKNNQAFQAHISSDHYKNAGLKDFVAEAPQIRILKAENVAKNTNAGSNPGQVDIVVVLKMKTEGVEKVRPIAEKLIEDVRKEKGNVRYDGYQDSKEPGTFVWLESYASMQAFQAHRESPTVQKYAEEMGEWVAAPPEVRILKPEYVKQ